MKRIIRGLLYGTALLTTLAIASPASAQRGQALRVEIEAKSTANDYIVVPTEKNGLLVFYESKEKGDKGERIWYFSKYDQNLKEVWTKTYSISKRMDFRKFDYDANMVYLLVSERPKKKSKYEILTVDMDNGKIASATGETAMGGTYDEFHVIGKQVYMGGTVPHGPMCACCGVPLMMTSKEKPMVMCGDVKSGNLATVQEKYKGQTFLRSVGEDEVTGEAFMLIHNHVKKNVDNVYLKTYKNGKEVKSMMFPSEPKKIIASGKLMPVGQGERYVIGTYGTHMTYVEHMQSVPTSGMYISKIEGDKAKFVKYYNFAEFNNFFSYYSDEYAEKMEKKMEKAKKKGKELSFNYNLIVHDIIPHEDKLLMVAEAYYPHYHTECTTTIDISTGRTSRSCHRVFDGYMYTHAVVAAFDADGKLAWDQTFKMDEILTMNLKERVKVMPGENDEVTILYSYNGAIKSQVVQGNTVVQGRTAIKIPSSFSSDVVKENYSSDLMYWYDKYFIAWGFQKIKDKEKNTGKKNRQVFYFTKIEVDQEVKAVTKPYKNKKQ